MAILRLSAKLTIFGTISLNWRVEIHHLDSRRSNARKRRKSDYVSAVVAMLVRAVRSSRGAAGTGRLE